MRHGAATSILASFVSLTVVVSGCSGKHVASELAAPVPLSAAGLTHCTPTPSQLRPLVVDRSGADRGSLELRLKEGVVAVRYEGCSLEILRDCEVPGTYSYSGFNYKQDSVAIHGVGELYTQMPVGGPRLEALLARTGELRVDITLVGMYQADDSAHTRSDLAGRCAGATHVIAAAQAGAFTFYTSATAEVAATGAVLATKDVVNTDGRPAACEAASTSDRAPPGECGALIRLELAPLQPEPQPAPRTRARDRPEVKDGDMFALSPRIRPGVIKPKDRSAARRRWEIASGVLQLTGGIALVFGALFGAVLTFDGFQRAQELKRAQAALDLSAPDFGRTYGDLTERRRRLLGAGAGGIVMMLGGFLGFYLLGSGAVALGVSKPTNKRYLVSPSVGRGHAGLTVGLRF